jgi:two-component system CheB/CheR fusion protein
LTTVLIADDSETILLLMRTRLEMEGHEVATAANGQEVVDTIQHSQGWPEVMLLDAMMPGKSGIDALRELRTAGWEVPALIVSAHQNPGDADAPTDDLGIEAYITKPIDFDRLLETIAELTAQPS